LDIFEWNGEDAWLNQHIFKVQFDKVEIDQKFFVFLIKYILEDLKRQVHGATMQHITKGKFDNMPVPLPPLTTQKRIAEILDKADALRRKDEALLRKYDELAQAVFVDMFGDLEDRNYLKARLEDVASIVNGVTKNEKLQTSDMIEAPYMRVANVQDDFLELKEIKTIKVSNADYQKYQLAKGDILLTEGGDADKLGRGTIWNEEVPGCIFQNHLFRVRVNSKDITPHFLNKLIGSKYGKKYFLRAAKQTTGIATINTSQLKAFPVVIPPLSEQLKFKKTEKAIREMIAVQNREIEASTTLFQTLLQKAFTGELVG
jgi:type I restriction enzyme S subunit